MAMKILIIEPFFTGSHRSWINGLMEYSGHKIKLLTMDGRHWKWRMHGGAVTMARLFNEMDFSPDLILTTDMMDLTVFISLVRNKINNIPIAIYFHENQLTYPWSKKDRDVAKQRDRHYGFINFTSALSADYVLYNSLYHMESFLSALPEFLNKYPDHNEVEAVSIIRDKSQVLPLGLDLKKFDLSKQKSKNSVPIILWNHRWEYDKNPEEFFNALIKLHDRGYDFKLAVLGEKFNVIPEIFNHVKEKLGPKILTFGFSETFEEYAGWLWKSDIIPVTNIQDFFGISIMEALYCGCIPALPKRLTYPELIPIEKYSDFFYNDGELLKSLSYLIDHYNSIDENQFIQIAARYDWRLMIDKYDTLFESMTYKHN